MNDILQWKIGSLTLEMIAVALLICVIGVIAVKLVVRILKKIFKRSSLDESLQNVIVIIVRFVLDALVILIALDYLGIPITSALTVLSIVGLAVSLAIQDTLANVFGGMILLASKTFASGEYVQIDSLEGTVVSVDLMNTHLRMADNKMVRIPNKDVQAAPIINFTREPRRRAKIAVTVPYDADTDAVKAALLRAAKEAPDVLDDPAPFAGLFEYQSGGINYVLQAWAPTSVYWDAYYQMTEGIRRTFKEDGIEMTYQHINVCVVGDKEDAR